jgi:SpoVK/Ycf46/Vps4 family AAA+-type ATPase
VEYPLLRSELYKKVGVDPPKGVLLIGSPGTGKTMIAKAVAHHTNATFVRLVGSELVQKYIGEGARLVRELFQLAREKAPTIIFIDELDSIGTIGGLKEAVTRLRKSNVAVVAAIQDLSQLVERYGRETAQTLFGCFSNRLFLRCVASDLAEKVAKELGEAEYEETRTQTGQSLSRQSQRRTSKGENTSFSSQYTRSPVQLATEITSLPVRTGFVTFAGINRVLPVNLSVGRRER